MRTNYHTATNMAENKRGFLLYADLIHISEKLSDAKAGRLFKHILRYVNDLDPKAPDEMTELLFEPIKQSLKRDLEKYSKIISKRREAGLKSAEMRTQHVLTHVSQVEQKSTHVDTSLQVSTVNVNVNVNDSDNEININKLNNLNASEIFFQIHLEKFIGKPSEFANKFHKNLLELNQMQHKIPFEQWAGDFDAEYQFKTFTNERHFQNAISSTFKKIKHLSYAKPTTAATTAIDSGRIKDLSGAKF